MNKITLLVLLIALNTTTIMAQQITPKLAFLEKWENSKSYLIAIAEAMPEENYNFKPTERQMTFKEQLMHIKGNMDWLSITYFTDIEYKKEKKELPQTKNETILALENAFDAVIIIVENTPDEELKETIDFFAGPKSKLQILNLLQDHVTHHRGQLIVYLNLNEIEPPKYSGW
tara:strand:- start:22810 stop:23328 length:519 start_codon:yes stop_codon:yes gene_type:complete